MYNENLKKKISGLSSPVSSVARKFRINKSAKTSYSNLTVVLLTIIHLRVILSNLFAVE